VLEQLHAVIARVDTALDMLMDNLGDACGEVADELSSLGPDVVLTGIDLLMLLQHWAPGIRQSVVQNCFEAIDPSHTGEVTAKLLSRLFSRRAEQWWRERARVKKTLVGGSPTVISGNPKSRCPPELFAADDLQLTEDLQLLLFMSMLREGIDVERLLALLNSGANGFLPLKDFPDILHELSFPLSHADSLLIGRSWAVDDRLDVAQFVGAYNLWLYRGGGHVVSNALNPS